MTVTLADLKAHLNVPSTSQDAELTRMLGAAVRHVERIVTGPLTPREVVERKHDHSGVLFLDQYPVQTVVSVAETAYAGGTATTYLTAALDVDGTTGRLRLLSGQQLRGDLTITYTAGFSPTPEDLDFVVLLARGYSEAGASKPSSAKDRPVEAKAGSNDTVSVNSETGKTGRK